MQAQAQEQPNSAENSSAGFSNWRDRASVAVTVAVAVWAAVVCLRPLLGKIPWMLYEEDDFFYYLQVARNLVHGAGSTFNSLVPTNGYHPLWLLVLTGISAISSAGAFIFAVLQALIFAATLATYLLSRRLLRGTGADRLICSALAAYVAIYSIHIFYGGMEVILTVPLLLGLVLLAQRREGAGLWWQHGLPQSFALGFLVAAMVLSRLDSVIFAALLLGGLLLEPTLRAGLKGAQMAGLALGVLPIPVYLAINHAFFHTWTPISGMAKQLKASHLPSAPPWQSLFGKTPAQLLNVVPIILALLLVPLVFKRLSAAQRVLYPALLVFPFAHLLIVSCFSDWKLWGWYFYAFRGALLASFAIFCLWKPTARLLHKPAIAGLVCLFVAIQFFRGDRGVGGQDEMYEVGVDLRNFAATHPGVYAMGDRSGMVGYLLPDPLVQTEGLMMDRDFLAKIAQQTPLRTALAPYHVRYYIATAPEGYSGCFDAREPYQAGPQSPQMKAAFCEQPVATFVHGTYRTMVFDLEKPLAAGDF